MEALSNFLATLGWHRCPHS